MAQQYTAPAGFVTRDDLNAWGHELADRIATSTAQIDQTLQHIERWLAYLDDGGSDALDRLRCTIVKVSVVWGSVLLALSVLVVVLRLAFG